MEKIELLAPAGDLNSLYAAVNMGADAVYLGGSKFSARAYASNFDYENLKKSVDFCHIYNVKVYVTVNTLVKENEIDDLIEYVEFLYKIGIDALIIQDIGAFYLIKSMFPDFEIHASTQMTVHNAEGALFLKNKGIKRIVLSRELSLDEVTYISKELGIETEIFIHGALCVSYSGQCLLSSVIGGRSGNRGRCAQPCRLPYNLIDKKSNKEIKGYLLSPKDICLISDINKIIESNAASLKIEGRMKRPEYVAGVVDVYRRAIDSYYDNSEFNFEKERKTLLQLFNREGFSKAYFFGNEGKDMMAYNFPRNTGIRIGKASDSVYVNLENELNIADGIRIGEKGYIISSIIKNNTEIKSAHKGDKVILKPAKYNNGDIIYKTLDKELTERLSEAYMNPYKRKIPLKLKVSYEVGKELYLESFFQGALFSIRGEIIEKAKNKPLSMERIIENLQKTKDTAFQFEEIEFTNFEEGFMPLSFINKARRELINKIENYIIKKSNKNIKGINNIQRIEAYKKDVCLEALVCVNTLEQLEAAREFKEYNLAYNPFMRQCNIRLEHIKEPVYIIVPNIIKEEFNDICNFLDKNKSAIKGLVTSNYGIINKYHDKFNIVGDYKLNLFNSYGIEFFKDILKEMCLSIELNRGELKDIVKNSKVPSMIYLYGRPELMVTEYCPVGSLYGNKSKETVCSNKCLAGEYVLKDRKGEEFIIKTDKFCRSHLYNNNPINLIPHLKDINNIGIRSFRLEFLAENKEEVKIILNAFKNGNWEKDFTGYTRGHYKRGVE